MKKIIYSILLIISILSINIIEVRAESIDPTRQSSLTVTYQYHNILLTDVDVSLYYLAGVDQEGSYSFVDEYQNVAFDTTNISSSELTVQADIIEKYILENNLQSLRVLKTDQNGTANFTTLVPGLYLVIVDSKEVDNYNYDASPTIINIPTFENGNYQYNVVINMKTEREELEDEEIIVEEDNNDNTVSVPNTIDNIILYISLLVVSIIIIITIIIYILKKGEKK